MNDELSPSPQEPFAPFRVDNLLMLVGGNPLPNAVSLPLLTCPGGCATLLHTHETQQIAERIARSVDAGTAVSSASILVDASDRVAIEHAIMRVLKGRAGTFGLHYTGGTKAMAVHAFRAVEGFARDSGRDAVFSYLDARRLAMMIDVYRNGRFSANPQAVPVGETSMTLAKMLALHDWEIKPGPKHTQAFMPKTTQAIAKINSQQYWKWLDWRAPIIAGARTVEKRGGWEYPVWHNAVIALPVDPALAKVRKALVEELALPEGDDRFDLDDARKKVGVSRDFFGEYLEAKWLEVLSLNALIEHRDRFGLKNIQMSFRPVLKTNPYVHFELDCVATRGYQLFAVSCTVDPERVAREHLFEAYVRARQIGGDEARMALVCTTGDADLLREKIRRDLDAEEKVRVFGRDDLPFLSARFGEWIEEASRGGK